MKNKNNKLRVVSLFSGIGGFELGLENSQLKGDTIFSSEIDRFATISYKANFPDVYQAGDITKVDEKTFQIMTYCLRFPLSSIFYRRKTKWF